MAVKSKPQVGPVLDHQGRVLSAVGDSGWRGNITWVRGAAAATRAGGGVGIGSGGEGWAAGFKVGTWGKEELWSRVLGRGAGGRSFHWGKLSTQAARERQEES
jgi:hypothetical protein